MRDRKSEKYRFIYNCCFLKRENEFVMDVTKTVVDPIL